MGVPVLLFDDARLAGLLEPHRDHLALPVGTGPARDLPVAARGIRPAVTRSQLEGENADLVGRPRFLERNRGLLARGLLPLGPLGSRHTRYVAIFSVAGFLAMAISSLPLGAMNIPNDSRAAGIVLVPEQSGLTV
jgi:hypothetical protein